MLERGAFRSLLRITAAAVIGSLCAGALVACGASGSGTMRESGDLFTAPQAHVDADECEDEECVDVEEVIRLLLALIEELEARHPDLVADLIALLGSETEPQPEEPEDPREPSSEVQRLPFPFKPTISSSRSCVNDVCTSWSEHYTITGLAQPTIGGARQMPIYRLPGGGRESRPQQYVGADQGTGYMGALNPVGTRQEFDVRHGHLRDGVGADALKQYLWSAIRSAGSIKRHAEPPVISYGGSATSADVSRLVRAVQLINTALPSEWKLTIDHERVAGPGCPGTVCYVSNLRDVNRNGVSVFFLASGDFPFPGSSGVSRPLTTSDAILYSEVLINGDHYASSGDREGMIVLTHELIHALGIIDHVSPRLNTIMENEDPYAFHQANELQPFSLLWPADREALRALYGRLDNGDLPTDLGNWENSSRHLHANGRHAAFGVAWRNGYGEPWAHGYLPSTDVADNDGLAGVAIWRGLLLGFMPGAVSVSGDAYIDVKLNEMTGRVIFSKLEAWAPRGAPGSAGAGTQWGDGDLAYSIAVDGNAFRQTGGDDGILTGVFFGENHEETAGTLERDDLTAAFGGKR